MKRLLAWFSILWLAAGAAAADPLVRTEGGRVRGIEAEASEQFLGVPYAAPPVGPLRWRPPGPVASWSGVRDASAMAEPCSGQANGDGPRYVNEDCLYLNIYRPAGTATGARLPVMVFLHGGANLWGSPNIYDGARMATVGKALVVIPAFRIGVFGALALPSDGKAGGGYTLQDQIAALAWVKRNASAFGGDPADVTVLGQSAGGGNVCALLAAAAAKGLFRQAVIESSACGSRPSLVKAQAAAREFGEAMGCPEAALSRCLRDMSAGKLLDGWKGSGAAVWGGDVLPADPGAALAEGRTASKVPVLIGFTRDEQWPYQHGLAPLNEAGYRAKLKERYGDRAAEAARLYPTTAFPHIEYALGAAAGDAGTVCTSLQSAAQASRFGPVYAYQFADRTTPPFKSLGPPQPRPPGYEPGAFHTAELQFILGYKAAERPLDAAQRARGDEMIRYWVGFNRGGAWPAWTTGRMMRFDETGAHPVSIKAVRDDHHCDFWKPGS